MLLSKTLSLVSEKLSRDPAELVIKYVRSDIRSWGHLAIAGEYETCMDTPKKYFKETLYCACKGGHKEMVELMISIGANNWNWGLYGACRGGQKEMIDRMISLGANDWNQGLFGAWMENNQEIMDMMISHGATKFWLKN